jgi:hypothetical protein
MLSTGNPPAKLHYMAYSFRILSDGDYVLCAETGQKIPLDKLRYWSIARQEPYIDAAASTAAEIKDRSRRGLPA